jgi:membrane-anchored glycerophosphoryl diester phosphodiesterase (GDPDase)
MNPIGTGGKVAAGFFDVMKQQPIVLALCVMNFALIAFVYYQSALFNSQRVDNIKLFVQMQAEVQKLLSACVVPAPPRT